MADSKKSTTSKKQDAKVVKIPAPTAANTSEKPVEKPTVQKAKPAAKTAKKTAVKKAAPKKKVAAKKTATKKAVAKKPAVKKTTAKSAAKKTTVKKAAVKKKAVQAKGKKVAAPKKRVATKKRVTKAKTAKAKLTGGVSKTQKSNKALFVNTQTMEKMMTQSKTKMDKVAKEATEMNRQAIEAVVKSSSIFAKGVEEMMRVGMSLAQDASAKQAQYMKEAMGSKTINEWAAVQSKIAQSNFDDFMSGATQISGLGVKTLSDAIEPINSQATQSVQKASNLMAA